MKHLSATQIKGDFSSVINEVSHDKERVILTRKGKDVMGLVPIEDIQLLEEIEDRQDIKAAQAAEKEAAGKGENPIPWEKAKKSLGL